MREKSIEEMDFKELRVKVQELYDELTVFRRKINDTINNLDSDNFGRSFTIEHRDMRTKIEATAEHIKATVSKKDLLTELEKYSTVEMTADKITTMVNADYVNTLIGDTYATTANMLSTIEQKASSIMLSVETKYETKEDAEDAYDEINKDVATLSSSIEVNKDSISAIVSGTHTKNILDNYLTGLVISPNSIKMVDNNSYSIYNKNGLRFYDSSDQIEGWAIGPSVAVGGVLKYYVNGGAAYTFGTGDTGTNYSTTDMVLKATNNQRGRFVVDVSKSSNREVKFDGLNYVSGDESSPYIYVNEKLLATQDWVRANGGGGGTTVAVFG